MLIYNYFIFIGFKLIVSILKSRFLLTSLEKVINFGSTEATTKLIEVNTNLISHIGIIKSISNQHLVVKIISQTACSSCQAKGACTSSEQTEKEIEIQQSEGVFFVGEEVHVVTTSTQGYKAIIYAYVLPLTILIISLMILINLTKEEALAALGSLLLLFPYYWLLYHFRHKLKKSFHFKVQKQSNISHNE